MRVTINYTAAVTDSVYGSIDVEVEDASNLTGEEADLITTMILEDVFTFNISELDFDIVEIEVTTSEGY